MTVLSKFISRKLLVTLLTIGLLVAQKQYDQAVVTAMTYLGAQGLIDAKNPASH